MPEDKESSKEKILREFDEKFPELHGAPGWHYADLHIRHNGKTIIRQADNLKYLPSFLSHALDDRKAKLEEAVEVGLHMSGNDIHAATWNGCLYSVLHLINKIL
jgi:hypothetical protein